MFEEMGLFAQAGECYLKQRKFNEAASMFEKGKLMPKAIECYEMSQSWDRLLQSLNRSRDLFKEEEMEALVNKYVPIALNNLYKIFSQESGVSEEVEEENKGKIQEMKIKMKYQKNID
jgi:hypothetical protein